MAYRNFRNENTYAAPEFEGLPRTLAALDTANRIKAQRENQQRSIQDNYKIANQYGYFPQNQDRINKKVALAVEALNYYKSSGGMGIPGEVKQLQASIEADANEGRTLWDALKQKEESIKNMKAGNPYYKDENDLKIIERAYDPNLSNEEIKGLLGQLNPGANKLTSFNNTKFLDDYVKNYGTKDIESGNKTESGASFENQYKGKFFINGKPGIGDNHIDGVLKNPDANEYYTQSVLKDLNNEYKQIVAGRFEEIPKTKNGITLKSLIDNGDDNAAINFMREHPELNPIDQRTEFQRKADMIRPELKDREDVQSKQKSDYSNKIPNSQWGVGNKNTIEAADGFQDGPTRIVLTKTGTGETRLPYVNLSRGVSRNADTGSIVQGGAGVVPGLVKNYKWGAIGADGAPLDIKAKNNQEFEQQLRAMPLLDRLKLKASPILSVKTVDKANVLDLAYNQGKIDQLESEARKNPDSETAQDMPALKQALEQIKKDESFNEQLIQKYLGGDFISNELIPVTKDDLNDTGYEAITGIRPTDPKSLNTQMKETKNIIEKIQKEAVQENNREQALKNNEAVNRENDKNIMQRRTTKKSTPVTSDGSDLDNWSIDKSYNVGGSIYFYDTKAKEWKKQ